jgi:hypothetical protein
MSFQHVRRRVKETLRMAIAALAAIFSALYTIAERHQLFEVCQQQD